MLKDGFAQPISMSSNWTEASSLLQSTLCESTCSPAKHISTLIFCAAAVPVGGLPALPPSQPNLVMNPLMANVLGGLSAEDVPFQEGWLKLRGIPFSVTKTDIIAFFSARAHTPCSAFLRVVTAQPDVAGCLFCACTPLVKVGGGGLLREMPEIVAMLPFNCQ